MRKYRGYWTLQNCIRDARKYSTRIEWKINSPSAYTLVTKRGWLKECTEHMMWVSERNKWTLPACKKDAKKYKFRVDWFNNSNGYAAASKNGWLDMCCEHMDYKTGTSNQEIEVLTEVKKIYPSATKKWFGKQVGNKLGTRFQLDVFIPEINKGVEFNGEYWHSEEGLSVGRPKWKKEDLKNYHKIKQCFFNKLGIKYIDIWQKDWTQNKNKCLMKIKTFLNQ